MRLRLSTAVAILALLATGTFGLASEGAEGAHEHAAAWISLAFSFLNFSIFLLLLRRYAWPALRDFLSTRQKEVVDAMAAAEQARKEADAIRREFSAKEAALEETRRRILEEIRQGAALDRERALREATAAAERLRAEAVRQAEHDLARARRELRAEAARLAADLAVREVATRLTDSDRARLVREFVDGVTKQ